jgi:general secretion pathway protein D
MIEPGLPMVKTIKARFEIMKDKRVFHFFPFVILALFLLASPMVCDSSFAATEDGELVSFNFVEVELSALTKFISDVTGKNFIFDERLRGKITIIAPSKLKADDAFNLYTSVLELKGFTVIPSGVNAYKIIPSAEAKQKRPCY